MLRYVNKLTTINTTMGSCTYNDKIQKKDLNENIIDENNIDSFKKLKNQNYDINTKFELEAQYLTKLLETPLDELCDSEVYQNSDVINFYTGSVLITGGTGFLGKVILEKILRTCVKVDTVYLLVRSKKGKNSNDRVEEIFENPLFKRVNKEQPMSKYKIVCINGDISLPELGLSLQDRQLLTDKVNVVIHSAATVRFNEKIQEATNINIKGTDSILQLASECKNLKSVVHISTAFVNCKYHNNNIIKEEIINYDVSYKELIKLTETKCNAKLEELTENLLKKFPNTYCLTKALTEQLIKEKYSHLPVCIFRPAIVVSSYREPYRSWTDNLFGPAGFYLGVGTGFLHVLVLEPKKVAHLVPVDLVANGIIVAGYAAHKNFKFKVQNEIKVYNYAGQDNKITWKQYWEYCIRYGLLYPTTHAIWFCSILAVKYKFLYRILSFFLHFVPAFLMDSYRVLCGKKKKIVKLYEKMDKINMAYSYFATKEFRFDQTNTNSLWENLSTNDKKLFSFDMSSVDWQKWGETQTLGLRKYILNEEIHTLPIARKKWRRFYYLHNFVKFTFIFIVLYLFWSVLSYIYY